MAYTSFAAAPLSALLAQRTRHVPTLPTATDLLQGQRHLAKPYTSEDHLLNTNQPKAATCSTFPRTGPRCLLYLAGWDPEAKAELLSGAQPSSYHESSVSSNLDYTLKAKQVLR